MSSHRKFTWNKRISNVGNKVEGDKTIQIFFTESSKEKIQKTRERKWHNAKVVNRLNTCKPIIWPLWIGEWKANKWYLGLTVL